MKWLDCKLSYKKEPQVTSPVKLNLKIYQGSTFQQTLRWESQTKVYVPITQITKTAPVVVTAANHQAPLGWRVKITGVQGMREINSLDTYWTVTQKTTDTVTLNQVNATGFTAYTSGGILEYNQPVDLTNFTARMQIRPKLESTTVIHELTTENSGIVINNTDKTIQLTIPATTTDDFDFTTAVYSLEMVKPNLVVPFLTGNVSLIREVTR